MNRPTKKKTFTSLILLSACLFVAGGPDRASAEEPGSFIWWEGEDFVETNSPRPVDPSTPGNQTPGEREKLSGGKWMTVNPPEDGSVAVIRYEIEVPVRKTYDFWVRKFWKHGPFKWRFGDGDWRICDKNIALADTVTLREKWGANWVFLGKVDLKQGRQTLEVEMIENMGCFDSWLLIDKPFTPRGKLKPGVKSGLAEEGYFAWEPDHDPHAQGSPIDLRHLNEEVAGMNGRVRREGNGFVTGDGNPVRFWMVEGNFLLSMKNQEIDYLARRFAKYGVNMVRVGIIPLYEAYDKGDLEGYHRALDKLHYVVAAMKRQGIYTKISHLFRHTRKTIPGEIAGPDYGNRPVRRYGLSFFNENFRNHYMGYAGTMLKTENPYTGTPLAKETAVAILEVQNETGLLFWTFNPWNTHNCPPPTLRRMEEAFGKWAARKYGTLESAVTAWHPDRPDPKSPSQDLPEEGRLGLHAIGPLLHANDFSNPLRRRDQLQFMVEWQKDFYRDMIARLREETGLESLIACSNWKTADPQKLGLLERFTYTEGDVICRNVYQGVEHDPKPKLSYALSPGDTYRDSSTLKAPNIPEPLTVSHVNDFPYMITESNWTQPNRFRAEFPFLVATYGRMMGVDGWDFFNNKGVHWSQSIQRQDLFTPAVFGQFPAAALLFRRGDVTEAAPAVAETVKLQDLYDLKGSHYYSLKGSDVLWVEKIGDLESAAGRETMQVEPLAFFVGKVNRTVGDQAGTLRTVDLDTHINREAGTVISLTGEMLWDFDRGAAMVDTARAQGACGFLNAKGRIDLGAVSIESENEFGSVLVVSLDGKPLADSGYILIQAATEDKYYGFQTEPAGEYRRITDLGGYPLNVKKIKTRVTLKGRGGRAVVLDENGYPTDRTVRTSMEKGNLVIDLPEDALYTIIQSGGQR